MEDQKRLVQAYVRGMHGCGSQASAPASDAAGRGRDAADRASVPRRAASCHVAILESGRRGPNRADSVRIGRIGRSDRNSKKNKKVQNAPFDLT